MMNLMMPTYINIAHRLFCITLAAVSFNEYTNYFVLSFSELCFYYFLDIILF